MTDCSHFATAIERSRSPEASQNCTMYQKTMKRTVWSAQSFQARSPSSAASSAEDGDLQVACESDSEKDRRPEEVEEHMLDPRPDLLGIAESALDEVQIQAVQAVEAVVAAAPPSVPASSSSSSAAPSYITTRFGDVEVRVNDIYSADGVHLGRWLAWGTTGALGAICMQHTAGSTRCQRSLSQLLGIFYKFTKNNFIQHVTYSNIHASCPPVAHLPADPRLQHI